MVNPLISHNEIELSHDEIRRYSRHLLLPEVGVKGQKKLKAASVLIIGTGGLGSPASIYLAAAGVGRIGLVDYDNVDLTNLQRQIVHRTSAIGDRKVDSAHDHLRDINPEITIELHDEPFTSKNALKLTEAYDLIIDASDNFPTRYLINDVCVLTGKPNCYGAILRFEGQASVFWAEHGPCYRCIFPEPPPPGIVPSCGESGVFGVLPGVIGCIQATEAIKLILGIGKPLIAGLILYDALSMSFDRIRLKKNPHCKICSEEPEITELIDYEEFCGTSWQNEVTPHLDKKWEIEPTVLAERLERGDPIRLIDVREPHEWEISFIQGAESIPLGSLATQMYELDKDQEIVLICKVGIRSARAFEILAGAGFQKVKNLHGGLNSWARQIDPTLPQY